MRIIVFFDLPIKTPAEIRDYNHFRKYLVKSGFVMMQESVYSKLALNQTAAQQIVDNIKLHKPSEGLVQVLIITEKQYSRIEFIVGEKHGDIINTDQRFLEL